MHILEAAHQRKLRGPKLPRRPLGDTDNVKPINEIVQIPASRETVEKVSMYHFYLHYDLTES